LAGHLPFTDLNAAIDTSNTARWSRQNKTTNFAGKPHLLLIAVLRINLLVGRGIAQRHRCAIIGADSPPTPTLFVADLN